MSRNPKKISAMSIMLWFMFIVNLAVLIAALLLKFIWLWVLSFLISFAIVDVCRSQRSK